MKLRRSDVEVAEDRTLVIPVQGHPGWAVELDHAGDLTVAQLLVQVEDGRILAVVLCPGPQAAELDRLQQRLDLQRPRDAAAANAAESPRPARPGDLSHVGEVRDARDPALVASQPDAVLVDARAREPGPHDLGIRADSRLVAGDVERGCA